MKKSKELDIEKNKEIFEYEMTEVVANLRGEFSHFAGLVDNKYIQSLEENSKVSIPAFKETNYSLTDEKIELPDVPMFSPMGEVKVDMDSLDSKLGESIINISLDHELQYFNNQLPTFDGLSVELPGVPHVEIPDFGGFEVKTSNYFLQESLFAADGNDFKYIPRFADIVLNYDSSFMSDIYIPGRKEVGFNIPTDILRDRIILPDCNVHQMKCSFEMHDHDGKTKSYDLSFPKPDIEMKWDSKRVKIDSLTMDAFEENLNIPLEIKSKNYAEDVQIIMKRQELDVPDIKLVDISAIHIKSSNNEIGVNIEEITPPDIELYQNELLKLLIPS